MKPSTTLPLYRNLRMTALLFALTVAVSSCYYDKEEELYPQIPGSECDTTNVSYAQFVAPLMASNCNGCHSEAAPSGNVVTSTYAGLKASVNSGQLRKAINHESGASAMPKGGNKLPACELLKIDAWIASGAPQN